MDIETAVIPAAGLGTRLRPATTVIPKVMLPLVTTPVLQLVVVEALEAGIGRIVIVVGHGREFIRAHFEMEPGPWKGRIIYVEQTRPLGLGHAIACAGKETGDRPFAVLFGDSVFARGNPTRELVEDFEKHGEAVLGYRRVSRDQVSRRGILEVEAGREVRVRVKRVVEKPKPEDAPSDLALVGRFVFGPSLMDALKNVEPDAGGEIQLTPAINQLTGSETVAGREIEEERLDVGTPEDYVRATAVYAAAKGIKHTERD